MRSKLQRSVCQAFQGDSVAFGLLRRFARFYDIWNPLFVGEWEQNTFFSL